MLTNEQIQERSDAGWAIFIAKYPELEPCAKICKDVWQHAWSAGAVFGAETTGDLLRQAIEAEELARQARTSPRRTWHGGRSWL